MKKYTNPFFTLREAIETLERFEVDPYNTNEQWPNEIINVMARREYGQGSFYHVCEIHITAEGFERACGLMEARADAVPVVIKGHFSDEYDIHYVEPTSLLKIFKLVPKAVHK